jgi:hypothetical protein
LKTKEVYKRENSREKEQDCINCLISSKRRIPKERRHSEEDHKKMNEIREKGAITEILEKIPQNNVYKTKRFEKQLIKAMQERLEVLTKHNRVRSL